MDSGEFGRVAFGGEGEHYAHGSKTRNTYEGIHRLELEPRARQSEGGENRQKKNVLHTKEQGL